jgi:flagellar export protein FliJ
VEHPFTFRLERVRSLRERAEEQAREELARGLGVRTRSEALLIQAAAAAQAARETSMDTALRGATARDLIAAQAFIERKELDRQAAALDLSRQEAEVEARRTALALAARDREVIERLERRKRSEHAAECARLDQMELDEIALAVHRRGAVAA